MALVFPADIFRHYLLDVSGRYPLGGMGGGRRGTQQGSHTPFSATRSSLAHDLGVWWDPRAQTLKPSTSCFLHAVPSAAASVCVSVRMFVSERAKRLCMCVCTDTRVCKYM